ncbi:MAG: AbrB/MazE/SpoVT family DNA-binding domain-containing protein [Oscillospiraceae bacterium]
MKSTGIVRKIDDLGRIVLPIELRRVLDIDKDSSLEIYTDNESIVLKKYQPACIFCGSDDGIISFEGRTVCAECRAALGKA